MVLSQYASCCAPRTRSTRRNLVPLHPTRNGCAYTKCVRLVSSQRHNGQTRIIHSSTIGSIIVYGTTLDHQLEAIVDGRVIYRLKSERRKKNLCVSLLVPFRIRTWESRVTCSTDARIFFSLTAAPSCGSWQPTSVNQIYTLK